MRDHYENRISDVSKTIQKLGDNIEDAQAEAAFREVLKSLKAWINTNREIKPIGSIHDSLIDTIGDKRTHAGSVRACVNRYGYWHNLDYYYQIGFGTRTEAVKTISGMLDELDTIIKIMLNREDLEPALEFLQELQYFCNSEAEKYYQEMQRLGHAAFKEKLSDSDELWHGMQDQWGTGVPGYKMRISDRTGNWFENAEQKRVHVLIQNRIAKGWEELLSKFQDLVEGIFQ